jgi:hypothetical protein
MVEIALGIVLKHIGSIIGVIALFAIGAWLSRFKGDLEKMLGGKTHFHVGVKPSVDLDKEIYMELSKLTVGISASRATIFKFHNGSVFNTNDPIWKISSTHEICETGVSSEGVKTQDIKSSLVYPLMNALFNKTIEDGITRVDMDEACRRCSPCLLDKGVYQIRPLGLSNRFVYSFFADRGSKYSIISPLSTDDNDIIGFLLIDFCTEGYMSPEDVIMCNRKICDATIKLSHLIG